MQDGLYTALKKGRLGLLMMCLLKHIITQSREKQQQQRGKKSGFLVVRPSHKQGRRLKWIFLSKLLLLLSLQQQQQQLPYTRRKYAPTLPDKRRPL
jgi:hypothetical protein